MSNTFSSPKVINFFSLLIILTDFKMKQPCFPEKNPLEYGVLSCFNIAIFSNI